MRAAGCEALADAHELAVMGLIELLPHLPRLLRLRARLADEISARRPDVFIGVDIRVQPRSGAAAQAARPADRAVREPAGVGMATGPRAHDRRACDLVLCLLPFEPQFYRERAVRARFVGHPLADQMPLQPDRAGARAALGLAAGATVLALLPGSRLGEVQRLTTPFLQAAAVLAQHRPNLALVAPMASSAVRRAFERGLSAQPGAPPVLVLDGQSRSALTAADGAFVASGTATLEALLCRCPMVVAYRFGALTALLVRSLRLVRLPHFALPNLLGGETLAPEFFQERVQPEPMALALEQLLEDAPRRAYLQQRFDAIHVSLRKKGAALAAEAVLQLLRERGEVRNVEHAGRGRG